MIVRLEPNGPDKFLKSQVNLYSNSNAHIARAPGQVLLDVPAFDTPPHFGKLSEKKEEEGVDRISRERSIVVRDCDLLEVIRKYDFQKVHRKGRPIVKFYNRF